MGVEIGNVNMRRASLRADAIFDGWPGEKRAWMMESMKVRDHASPTVPAALQSQCSGLGDNRQVACY